MNKNGLSLINNRLYSQLIPNEKNLDECLSDKSDLTSGALSAVNAIFQETNGSYLSEITNNEGRTTKLFKVNDSYLLRVVYDRNTNNYEETEHLIDNLFQTGRNMITNNNDLMKQYEQTGDVSGLEPLHEGLGNLFDMGYNNQKTFSYLDKLKSSFEREVMSPLFSEKDIANMTYNISKLKKLKTLFPQLNINIDKYESRIEDFDRQLIAKKQENEQRIKFKNEIKQYGMELIKLTSTPTKQNIEKLAAGLMFPELLRKYDSFDSSRIKSSMTDRGIKLNNFLKKGASDLEIQIEAISLSQWIKGMLVSNI